jgi:hypothetical protein
MQKTVVPRATRKLDQKCLIIVHKSIHKFLRVSNVYSERFKSFSRSLLIVTSCKQTGNVFCEHSACGNCGGMDFLVVENAATFSTKISTGEFAPN